jgi:uncharacterized protein (DUF305 family)
MSVSVHSEAADVAVSDDDQGETPVRRGFGVGWLAIMTVVGLALGLIAGLNVPHFTRPGDDSAEAGFARDMSTHHAQAVEMAMLAHEKGDNADVRSLGADIALTQQAQIGMMQTWLRDWNLSPTGSQPRMAWMGDGADTGVKDGLMPGMATDAERKELRAATGKAFDLLFLKLMLNHHIGGIHMAEGVVKLTDDKDVRFLAQNMVDSQRREVAALQDLIKKLG